MSKEDSYSIKEMITEFRADVKESFDKVNFRLDKSAERQDTADKRTSNLEARLVGYEDLKKDTGELVTVRKAAIMLGVVLMVILGFVYAISEYAFKGWLREYLSDNQITLQDTGWQDE